MTGRVVEWLEPRRMLAAAIAGVRTTLLPAELNPTIHTLQLGASVVGPGQKSIWGALFSKPAAPTQDSENFIHPISYAPFTIDESALRSELSFAPAEDAGASMVLAIPTPDGALNRFDVVESSIMEPGLAAQFPEIKTFAGTGIDDPAATIQLDVTDLGFHAQVLSPNGDYYIDPYWQNQKTAYISYFGRDLYPIEAPPEQEPPGGDANVSDVAASEADLPGNNVTTNVAPYGTTLRTFRTAVAADHQYVAFWGGTVAAGQSAIVTAINRVTGIYETELDVRLVLVANNSSVVYASAATDPYSNGTGALSQNTPNLNSVIGSANYDVGHVFTTGSGGVAYLGVVGGSLKGGGTTGLSAPTGDAFYVDYVAHEMGHEFGANHTFNTSQDSNRSASHAYEPGSGSTIMAYAGIEGTEDLQPHSDPYFHSDSIDAIRNFLATIPSVGTSSSTGNNPPTVSAGSNYTIPTGTPFALTASGSDPDSDPITYEWEERDLGAATLLTTPDNGSSPLFRDYVPSTGPTRMFPQLATILAGQANTAAPSGGGAVERLPTVARTAMKFRVLVRDSRPGGGGVASADMQVKVVNTGSSFGITNFNSSSTLAGGSQQTLLWNVAGTTANGINTANVSITMSTDGGNTFPITLDSSTANDGSDTVQMQYNTASSQVRFKIAAVGNIFFDINDANLAITNVPTPSPAPTAITLAAASDTGPSADDGVTNLNNSAAKKLTFIVAGTTPGATVNILSDGFVIGSATATGTSTTVLSNGTTTLLDGSHSITATQLVSGFSISPPSPAGSIIVDTIAPTLGALAFDPNQPAMTIEAPFSEDVSASLAASTLSVSNVATSSQAVSFDPAGKVASFNFIPGYPAHGVLPDGNYTATLLAANVTDLAGNHPAADATLNFFVLSADANLDRTVNALDFNAVATNFGGVGKTFSDGDFNYDGNIDSADFTLLAQKFSNTLAAPIAAVQNAPLNSLFNGDHQGDAKVQSIAEDVL